MPLPLFDAELRFDRPIHELRQESREMRGDFYYHPEEDIIVRDIWQSDLLDSDLPEYSLQLALRHHHVLRRLGMSVVSYAQEAIPAEAYTEVVIHRDYGLIDHVAAHYAVPFVDDIDPLCEDEETELQDRSLLGRVNHLIADPLQRYIDWCLRTKQPHFLSDVYRLDQYSRQYRSGVLFLHDIEPRLLPVNLHVLTRVTADIDLMRKGLMSEF